LGSYAKWLKAEHMELSGVYFSGGKETGRHHSVQGSGVNATALGKKLAEAFRR
jgi:hypothetical protein